MTRYHAVLTDETGCEFGADIDAPDRATAHDELRDMYPESRVVQLESPQDARDRESRMHAHISAGGDWDDEGQPIFHNDPDW